MKNSVVRNRIFKNYFLLTFLIFLTEIIFRLILSLNIFDWAVLRIFIGSNIIGLILGIIASFLPEKLSNIFNIGFIFILDIYAIFQIGFSNFMGTFMSLNASSQLGKVWDYLKDYVQTFSWEYYLILIPLLLIIFFYIFVNKKIKRVFHSRNKISYVFALSILFGLVMAFYITLSVSFMQNKYQTISNKKLFYYPEIPSTVINQYGVSIYGVIDCKSYFLNIIPIEEETVISVDKKDEEITDYTRIVNDEVWREVIDAETNSNMKKLNNYFVNRSITSKNEMTGYFKDKNLIVILMESVNTIPFLYPEYFPTLNKMYNEGWSWTNNYTPRNSCSTGNNEMTVMTSLYTINNSCTANTYKDNKYFEAIFNLFNNSSYYTSSYHNYSDGYYYRKTIHPNMGSQLYLNGNGLGIKLKDPYEEWPSDIDLITKSIEKYVNKDKFMTFYSTVTTHRPYTVNSEYGDKYLDVFNELDISTAGKRYLSKMKELDDALLTLLNTLEEKNELDDTVIVLFADHYPYGLSNTQLQEFFDYKVTQDYERDRTPFVIYNKNLTPTKYDEYTTIMNILPTVANLFDLNYDPRYYMGTDLFSEDSESIAIFTDGSWRNEDVFYNAKNSKISYYNDVTYSDEEIISKNNKINEDIKMSNLAIRINYFEKLKEKMNKVLASRVVPEQLIEETDNSNSR